MKKNYHQKTSTIVPKTSIAFDVIRMKWHAKDGSKNYSANFLNFPKNNSQDSDRRCKVFGT